MGALMNCHEPPCGMGREDSRPGTGHPGGHTGHPGGMPAGPRTLEDGSPLCRLIAWEVTRSCNLACKHCRAEAHPEPYPGELSTEEAKALIDTFPSVGNPIIIFTGGDPMIRPDVYELIAYAGSKGLRCVMSPNGTLITPENARKIKEAGVQRCSISIDGYNAEKHDAFRCVPGAFDATMRGIVKTLMTNSEEPIEIYGFEDGYQGLIYSRFRVMTPADFSGILTRGGTILGTSRTPFKRLDIPEADGVEKVPAMVHTYHKLQLDCLFMLGGNGSAKTANRLREEGLNVIALPKTIDNDTWGTEMTFGFTSAIDVATKCIDDIHTLSLIHI